MKIIAHCLVKNEENFIWYAINSVIDYVDEVMVWDNGSSDNTVSIIKLIKSKRVKLREVEGKVSQIRQEMLDETRADWIFLIDGDEVWWRDSVKKAISEVTNLHHNVSGVATPFYNCVGDIFHYQEKKAGRYQVAGKSGHLTLRFMRTEGMKLLGTYPYEFYTLDRVRPLQESSEIEFIDAPYLHLTHLSRSSTGRKGKEKSELGISFPLDFYYPEVFFEPRPLIVSSPWSPMITTYKLNAFWQTPLKKIKRRLLV